MEDAVRAAFPGPVYENSARAPHSGDATLLAPNYGPYKCMLEYKSHARSVGDGDVAKLARDLDAGDCAFAVMATRTANVARRRDFSVERTPGGKPVLFLVRTDECPGAVGPLLRWLSGASGGSWTTTATARRRTTRSAPCTARVGRREARRPRSGGSGRRCATRSRVARRVGRERRAERGRAHPARVERCRRRRAPRCRSASCSRCCATTTRASRSAGSARSSVPQGVPRSTSSPARRAGTPSGGGDWWALKNGPKTVCVVEAVPPLPPVAVGEPGLATKTAL